MLYMEQENIFNCPRCSGFFARQPMRKLQHPAGILLDVCDKCHGMWIDGHEIAVLEKSGILADNKKRVGNGKKKGKGGKK